MAPKVNVPAKPIVLPLALASAAGLALSLGVESAINYRYYSSGVLTLALPWLGAGFYAALTVLARLRPHSPWLSYSLGLYTFTHATLVTESVLESRLCLACLGIATVAAAAAVIQILQSPGDRITLATGIMFGVAAGFISPIERMDELLTQRIWPSRVFSMAPDFVDRQEMAGCNHGRAVRILIFEKDCKS